MLAQVKGILELLPYDCEIKKVVLDTPWKWLPYSLIPSPFSSLTEDSDRLTVPWPDVVVSCGRRTIPISIAIKQASGGRTRSVYIHDPGMAAKHFDLIVAMEHDKCTGDNVIKTRYAIHQLTHQKLEQAANRFVDKFSRYETPLIAVLIGGSTNRYKITTEGMEKLLDKLEQFIVATHGSLLITPSRRTGTENIALLKERFSNIPNQVYIYDPDSEERNPYMAMLALADYIVVTNDSVNMMTEACFTGKPVYILDLPEHYNTKPARFANKLLHDGTVREFDQSLDHWEYAIPDERPQIVSRIVDMVNRMNIPHPSNVQVL